MNSTLNNQDIEDFFIRLYFNTTEGFFNAAIRRAYLDFNRTLRMLPKEVDERQRLYDKLALVLKKRIEIVLNEQFINQEKFTLCM